MSKGARLRQLREELGISQVDAAEKIGVSKQTLYKYEKDIITNIPSDVIERMAKLYNTTPSYLMGWDEVSESLAKAQKDVAERMQPISEQLKIISQQVSVESEKFKKAVEIFEQIEILPEDKIEELTKYLRYLQSQL